MFIKLTIAVLHRPSRIGTLQLERAHGTEPAALIGRQRRDRLAITEKRRLPAENLAIAAGAEVPG